MSSKESPTETYEIQIPGEPNFMLDVKEFHKTDNILKTETPYTMLQSDFAKLKTHSKSTQDLHPIPNDTADAAPEFGIHRLTGVIYPFRVILFFLSALVGWHPFRTLPAEQTYIALTGTPFGRETREYILLELEESLKGWRDEIISACHIARRKLKRKYETTLDKDDKDEHFSKTLRAAMDEYSGLLAENAQINTLLEFPLQRLSKHVLSKISAAIPSITREISREEKKELAYFREGKYTEATGWLLSLYRNIHINSIPTDPKEYYFQIALNPYVQGGLAMYVFGNVDATMAFLMSLWSSESLAEFFNYHTAVEFAKPGVQYRWKRTLNAYQSFLYLFLSWSLCEQATADVFAQQAEALTECIIAMFRFVKKGVFQPGKSADLTEFKSITVSDTNCVSTCRLRWYPRHFVQSVYNYLNSYNDKDTEMAVIKSGPIYTTTTTTTK